MWRWKKYIPVAKHRAYAKRKVEELRKKGKVVDPIEIQGRSIAEKFWGKQWCAHLETFADFENRLPRGRSCVRNGSVCHLVIKKGLVEALVNGNSLYSVKVKISTLKETKWKTVKDRCSGHIGSLLELLKGELSDHVMEAVANSEEGLFPNEEEVHFSCSCPDWASMCKHVAAVLYGIGSRLDERPDLLFLLRGVDAKELITTKLTTLEADSEDLLHDEKLSDIFGIDIDKETDPPLSKQNPTTMTGKDIEKARVRMNFTVREFAEALGVTSASIYRWEKKRGVLNLHARSVNALAEILEKAE